jgi:hypothetical protein
MCGSGRGWGETTAGFSLVLRILLPIYVTYISHGGTRTRVLPGRQPLGRRCDIFPPIMTS